MFFALRSRFWWRGGRRSRERNSCRHGRSLIGWLTLRARRRERTSAIATGAASKPQRVKELGQNELDDPRGPTREARDIPAAVRDLRRLAPTSPERDGVRTWKTNRSVSGQGRMEHTPPIDTRGVWRSGGWLGVSTSEAGIGRGLPGHHAEPDRGRIGLISPSGSLVTSAGSIGFHRADDLGDRSATALGEWQLRPSAYQRGRRERDDARGGGTGLFLCI